LNRAPCRRSPAASPPARPAAASRPHWHSCRTRSIASKRARLNCSTDWKRATTPGRGACAASSSTSASTSARCRPRRPAPPEAPSCGRAARRRAAPSSGSSNRISLSRAQVDHLNRAMVAVPIRRPAHRRARLHLGLRREDGPLLPRAGDAHRARHAGKRGEPVHATAPARWCRRAGAAATAE